jgi:hypothetical protein
MPDSRLFLAYNNLSASLTHVLAAGAASGFFAWWVFAAREAEVGNRKAGNDDFLHLR